MTDYRRRDARWEPGTDEIVNALGNGSGHPVAITGVMMVRTLIHELRRQGGGMASALVLEVPAPSGE